MNLITLRLRAELILSRRTAGLVCAACGMRFPMPGPVYEGSVLHDHQDGTHQVSYIWPPRLPR